MSTAPHLVPSATATTTRRSPTLWCSLSLRPGYLHPRLDVVLVARFILLTSTTEIISYWWCSSHSTDPQRPGRERHFSTRARRFLTLSNSRHVNPLPQRQQIVSPEAVANKLEQAHPIPRCRSHGRRLPTRTAGGPAQGSRRIMSRRAGGQVLPMDCGGRMRTVTA